VTEFTGERVIPGQVNADLWAEHIARYRFATRYAHGRVLDLGCGTGYGIAELAKSADLVVGIDIAAEAIAFARAHYPLTLAQASTTALPFAPRSFQLITAFEVIEHLEHWPALIAEAKRTLAEDGTFLVSTPNRLYYTSSRGAEGANPFHVHEFTFAEFRDALQSQFPHVEIFEQNRTEAFAFTSSESSTADTQIEPADRDPDHAHFFLAVCGNQPASNQRAYLYVPKDTNLLREREQHIELLQSELHLTKETLATLQADHYNLVQLHARQNDELEARNRWALKVESDWRAALDRIAQLQEELKTEQAAGQQTAAAYAAKVAELEEDNRAKTQWAVDTEARLTAELAAKCDELLEAVRLLDRAEATVAERTLWAQDLQKTVDRLDAQIKMVRHSRWVRMGRAMGVGPQVQG